MADRSVVRQGSVVSLSLGAFLATAALGLGADDSTAPKPGPADGTKPAAASPGKAAATVAPENRPYKIRAWLSIDPRARVDARGRETLIAGWKTMMSRFVGAPWEVEIDQSEGPLATNALDTVTPDMVLPLTKGFDKAWMIRVEPTNDGLSFAAREFDQATAQVGLLCRRQATVLADGPRALLRLCLDIFAPSGEVAELAGGKQKLRVQGALVPAATPIGEVISVGSVFRPSRIFYKPEGGVLRLDVIKSTYLVVEKIESGVATCSVVSALANAMTTRVVGKAKMVGVGLKPAYIPTRLRFTFFNESGSLNPGAKAEERPAAGYTVVATPVPNGSPREVGTTDREGRLVLEPGFAEGLVRLSLIAAGTEPLTSFPIMPGEMVEEKLLNKIDPRAATVRIESQLYALRDEIIDLIAVRHRLESRMTSRANANNWEDVKALLEQWKAIPSRDIVDQRLTKLDEALTLEAEKNKRLRVRTQPAMNLITDTRNLIDRYLTDEKYVAIQDAVERYNAQQAASKIAMKNAPKALELPGGAKASTPIAIGSNGAFAPAGAGFTVTMPGPPIEATSKASDGTSVIKTYRFVDPVKGTFTVSYWDYPVAIAAADLPKALDTERDRLVATIPGGKVSADNPYSAGGSEGKQVSIDGLPTRNGEATSTTARILIANSRIYSVSISGTKTVVGAAPALEFLNSFKLAGSGSTAAASTPAPANTPANTPAKPASDPRASTSAGAKSTIDRAREKADQQNNKGGAPF